ncbi:MAG TPA: hypothetical protein PLV93_09100 [Microthrixaceae bacterium]|nr:hypothetical protein [Microthrixaceae bacterium]
MNYFDDNGDSPAADLWGERVNSYIDGQEESRRCGLVSSRTLRGPRETTPCSAT